MNLIFLYGPPAAGKLTVAQELVKLTGYTLIDNHKVRDFVTTALPFSGHELGEARVRLVRKIFVDVYEAMALANLSVVTTFAAMSPGAEFIDAVRQTVEAACGKVFLVQLLPSCDVLLERVTAPSRKDQKIDNVARWHEAVGDNPSAFETYTGVEHCVIDNSDLSAVETARQILSYYHL